MRKSVADALERIEEKLEALEEKIAGEEQTAKIVEDKVFELKAVSYLTLVMVAVLLFLVLGVLLKAVGF